MASLTSNPGLISAEDTSIPLPTILDGHQKQPETEFKICGNPQISNTVTPYTILPLHTAMEAIEKTIQLVRSRVSAIIADIITEEARCLDVQMCYRPVQFKNGHAYLDRLPTNP